jgi:beta-phosphoglucomutase-like phosphatase (HAD superfamily)
LLVEATVAFQGIIFDFNGVLWWDSHLQVQAWQQCATAHRGTGFSEEEFALHVLGRTNQHTLTYLIGRPVDGQELHERTQHKESIYRQLCLAQGEHFTLSPGAQELLDFLVAHQIPRTIATASERSNLDFFIAHFGLTQWFDIAHIVYDDGARPGKPAPDIYLHAAQHLGLAPADCVVVEDARSGIQAAHAAQVGHIVALGPRQTHGQLRHLEGVSTVIENLYQFPRERLFLA